MDYYQRHKNRIYYELVRKKARNPNEKEMSKPAKHFLSQKDSQGPGGVVRKFIGGKRKKLKGGAQERPPVNVYKMVDDLINLGININMSNIEKRRLQNKYQEIMINIKNANKTNLKKVFVEIHHVMFKPNSGGITPINLYNVSLRPKLQAIKNKICKKIDCSILKSDPYSTHFGGKRKTRKCKKIRSKNKEVEQER